MAGGAGALAALAARVVTRAQRSVHRTLWLALAMLVGLGFLLALGLRPSKGAETTAIAVAGSAR